MRTLAHYVLGCCRKTLSDEDVGGYTSLLTYVLAAHHASASSPRLYA